MQNDFWPGKYVLGEHDFFFKKFYFNTYLLLSELENSSIRIEFNISNNSLSFVLIIWIYIY